MTTGRRRGLAPRVLAFLGITAMMTIAGLVPVAIVGGQGERYLLEIGATLCERAPDTLSPPALGAAACGPVLGVRIEVQNENGEPLGDCLTALARAEDLTGTCIVPVPFDTTTLAYEDESTVPDGYAPLEEGLFERTPPPGVPGYPPQVFINVPTAQQPSPPATAEATAPEFSITLRFYTCAPGVTAAEVPSNCVLTGEGFPVLIASLEGVAEPLEVKDANRVDDAYVFGNDIIRRRGLFGRLDVRVSSLPAGYSDFVVRGDQVTFDEALNRYVLRLPFEAPRAEIAVFALNPAETSQPAGGPEPSRAKREIAVRSGNCNSPGPDQVVSVLTDVTPPHAAPELDATAAEVWLGTIPIPLSDLATFATLEVRLTSGDVGEETEPIPGVACGALLGTQMVHSMLTVALRGVGDDDLTSIAFITADAANPGHSTVVVFLAAPR